MTTYKPITSPLWLVLDVALDKHMLYLLVC